MAEAQAQGSGGPLEGRAAVVTGGSRGIGRAIVERLARDGARVVFCYAAREEAAAEVARAVAAAGGEAHPVRADLAEAAAAEQLMETAEKLLGGVDVLVNNASAFVPSKPLAEIELSEYERMMAVNARATFLTLRWAARRMRHHGRIITLSTANTVRPAPGNAPYAASKGAVEQMSLSAAMELGAKGITVNCVLPGATDTELLHAANPDEEKLALAASVTPLGRLGQPADVADVVAFLASPDSRWLTAQCIRATGGLA